MVSVEESRYAVEASISHDCDDVQSIGDVAQGVAVDQYEIGFGARRDSADNEPQAKCRGGIHASRSERLARADDVTVNDRSLETLRAAVEALHRRYTERCR